MFFFFFHYYFLSLRLKQLENWNKNNATTQIIYFFGLLIFFLFFFSYRSVPTTGTHHSTYSRQFLIDQVLDSISNFFLYLFYWILLNMLNVNSFEIRHTITLRIWIESKRILWFDYRTHINNNKGHLISYSKMDANLFLRKFSIT